MKMFLVERFDGKYWDGFGWGQKGRIFLSIGNAIRSLYEEGESLEEAKIKETRDSRNDATA